MQKSVDPYQMLPLWATVNPREFSKVPVLLEPHYQISVISRTLIGGWGVLPLCREEVSVFYSPSRLGNLHSQPALIYLQSIFQHMHFFNHYMFSSAEQIIVTKA